jgi:RHS repeat-associated protein
VSYGYEAQRNLKSSVSNRMNGSLVSQFDYTYDALGRRTSVKNAGSAFAASAFTQWGYDERNQVTSSDRYLGTTLGDVSQPVTAEQRAYQFDPIGNRETATAAGTQTSYTSNVLNQYSAVGQAAPTYDDDGNMTHDGTKVLTYNAENQLVSVAPVSPSNGDKRVTFAYDYVGRRVKKSVEVRASGSWTADHELTWVYSGWNKIQETRVEGATTSTKNFVWGLDLSQSREGAGGIGGLIAVVDDSGDALLFAYDGNGNVGELLGASDGSVNAHYEYDAFGNAVLASGSAASENSYRFSTKYLDGETGLYYYGYRYLETSTGRWVNRDPAEEQGGINLYGFVENRPNGTVDALGLSPALPIEREFWLATHESPTFKMLANHYMDGTGSPIKLSVPEMISISAIASLKNSDEFTQRLTWARDQKLTYFYFGGAGVGGARTKGTLGHFTINWLGTVDVCEDTWKFRGRMTFSDVWDFNIFGTERNWKAQLKTIVGNLMPGRPFKITSEWVDARQNNTQALAKWIGSDFPGLGDDISGSD